MERPTTSTHQQAEAITTNDGSNNNHSNWDEAVPRMLQLLDRLEQANAYFGALVWEHDWEKRDLIEDIQSMRQMLREGLAESSFYHSQVQRILDADTREIISDLEAALRAERSKNWELSYYARDIEEDKWKLQVSLRDSVPAQDKRNPLSKAKTAMEHALEMEIVELRERLRNTKGRGRSKSV
ncbi:hypothetical protein QBC41DRAFT_399334 [Cercophora samala]|uniref:Uncharacterized protein n=1 Tax=Cercophora samala TaxID=330535 RepID=A0AA40D9U9_9PEZI|nr:hypothetical protein QBC41DRAFT_399334 [Cercophora samala]